MRNCREAVSLQHQTHLQGIVAAIPGTDKTLQESRLHLTMTALPLSRRTLSQRTTMLILENFGQALTGELRSLDGLVDKVLSVAPLPLEHVDSRNAGQAPSRDTSSLNENGGVTLGGGQQATFSRGQVKKLR